MKLNRNNLFVAATAFITLTLAAPSVLAASGDWNVDNSGNWSLDTNWNPVSVPGTSNGDIIGLSFNITAASTVTIDTASRTAGILNIGDSDNTHSFTLAASDGGFLTLNNNGTSAQINETGSILDTLSTNITLADNLAVSAAGSLTLSGIVGESGGAKSLTQSGTGTLSLSGVNTYTGTTTISGGTLSIDDGSIATSSNIVNSAALIYNLNAAARTYANVISGSGMLTKTGTNNLTLSGANTYTGATTISGGILILNNAAALGGNNPGVNGPITLNGGAAINTYLAGSANIQIVQGIGGTGDLTLRASAAANGSALYRLQGASTYSGNTTFSTQNTNAAGITVQNEMNNALPTTTVLNLQAAAGASGVVIYRLNGRDQTVAGLQISGTGALNAIVGGSTTLSTLTVNNSAAYTFAGKLGNTGTNENNLALVKQGVGTLTLSGANTYTGDTTVTAGVLAVSGTSIADTGKLVIAGGKVNLTGTETVNTLFFGTVQQPAGNYTTTDPSTNFTGAGTLTVLTGPAGFSSWITGTFANGTVPVGQQGPNADPDNDGISNLVEYAIAGQDPTVGNPVIGTFNGTTLSFIKRAGTAGLTYAIQDSTDLGLTDIWAEVSGGSYVNNATTISYTLTLGTPAKNFLRLQVLSN